MSGTKTALPIKTKIGRPTKFTPEMVERILRCVERGMPLSLAANAAGISFQSLCSYRQQHPTFAESIETAAAKGIEKRLQKIESASDSGEWRAAAWLLEHCNPEKFARNRIEVTGADGSPIAAGMIQIYLPRKESIVEGNIIEAELSLPTERSKGEAN